MSELPERVMCRQLNGSDLEKDNAVRRYRGLDPSVKRSKLFPCPYILGRDRRHKPQITQLDLKVCIRHIVGSIEKTDRLRASASFLAQTSFAPLAHTRTP